MHISFLSRTWGYGATEEYYLRLSTLPSVEGTALGLGKSYNFNSFYSDKDIPKVNCRHLLNQTAQSSWGTVVYSNWQSVGPCVELQVSAFLN